MGRLARSALPDSSLETTMYKLERVDPIPPNFTTFSQFIVLFAEANKLTRDQRGWILHAVKEHIPFWLVVLWEGFPEWDYLNQALNKAQIQFMVGPPSGTEGGARIMRLAMHGKVLAQAYI